MEIWLKNDDYNIRFPVLPSEYTITSSSNNTTVNITELSEVNLLGNRNLQEISFETFFPKIYDSSFCDCKLDYTPHEYRNVFEKMKRSGVCKLTLSGARYSSKVTIEELTAKEDDGTGDVTISFKFQEYVKPKIYKSGTGKSSKKSSKKSTRKSSTRTTKVASKSTTYTVKKGDCLSRIAQAQTGNSSNWRTIYSDNKTVIGSNPNLIKIGQKLKIRASY